ncbi:MAG: AI-2E family transporter [Alphaproteobacteria bacterium]|nr:AI-2E family transporter [Alphaproteobacteria bacterium]
MTDAAAKSDILRSHFRFVVTTAIVVAFLVVARPLLVPLAIALLVWGLLNAIIDRLAALSVGGRRHLPHWAAVTCAIALIVVAVAALSELLASQMVAIAAAAPDYAARVDQLFTRLVGLIGSGAAATMQDALTRIDFAAGVSAAVGTAGSMILTLVLVGLYAGFLFAEQHILPRKIAALFPRAEETENIHDIVISVARSIRRYVWILSVAGILKAAAAYILMKVLGLDFAATWALIIFVLNFIPNIGPSLSVLFPTALALIHFDSLWPAAIAFAGLALIQFLIGSVIQPTFMGRSLNLSPFIIILSLAAWGLIWGIVGIFLAVPIMAMVMIICGHMPDLRWVAVMLSKDGRIEAEEA